MRVDEQARAARPDRSVLLSASAGSGKTRALVQRIMHLLAAGANPESVAAITFTEKASAQMKDKLFAALGEAAHKGYTLKEAMDLDLSDMPYPLKRTPEEILSLLTCRPDALKVSTIHAFCLGLLRQFPIESGLPEGFSLMDEFDAMTRRERAVDECLEAVDEGPLAAEFRIIMDAGYDLGSLKLAVLSALEKRSHIAKAAVDAGGVEGFLKNVRDASRLAAKAKAAKDLLGGGVISRTAEELASLLKKERIGDADYIKAVEALADVSDINGFPEAFDRLTKHLYTKEFELKKNTPVTQVAAEKAVKASGPSLKGGALAEAKIRLKGEHDSLYHSLRDAVNLIAGILDEVGEADALIAFLKIYRKAETIYAGDSRRDGLADFDDLEIYAYRLLSGPHAADALYRLESRALHYLMDEFQDTGDLQWGILKRLNSEVLAGRGIEGPGAPTLFAVGDEKQSIYRFRRANPKLMGILRQKMELLEVDRRDIIELDYNFRSAPEVLKVVDETFGVLIGDKYHKAKAMREGAKGSVRLVVAPGGSEPAILAGEVAGALGLPLWDDEGKVFRPAEYGDMAVLIRGRGALTSYEEAMRLKGIPFKVVGGVGFFYRDEVQALIGVLNYLENPADLLSLASALKSPMFRLSDSDIEPIYGSADPVETMNGISPDAYRLFTAWKMRAGFVPLGRLLEGIVEESGAIFAFGVTGGGGPAAALNIEKLVGIAREFDRKGGAGLPEFAEWVKAYREKSDIATADVELPGYEDFVSIMTVHAAKGLEFPVVFLPGLSRGTRKDTARFLLEDTPGEGIELALWTAALLKDNPRCKALRDIESGERAGETVRLLYVAMTRAKDHLVLTAERDDEGGVKAPEESWASLLLKAAPAALFKEGVSGGLVEDAYGYPEGHLERMRTEGRANMACVIELAAPDAGLLKGLPDEGGVSIVSPSGLVHALPEESGGMEQSYAMLRGVLIHSALEGFGRHGAYDMKAAARRAEGFTDLGEEAGAALLEDAGRAVAAFLADARLAGLISSGEGKYHELPLMMKREGEIVSGQADLVIVEGRRGTVIDYKTGFTGVSTESLREAYAPQMAAYAEAVKGAFGLEEVETCLLLIDRRELLPVR